MRYLLILLLVTLRSNPMGPRRTWQQVKTKYISDNKRKAALKKMRLVQTEEELPPENNVDSPIIASIVGGCWSDPGDTAGCSSYVTVTDHGLALLQPPVLSDEELDFEPVEDVKTLHKKYLQVEISDRKQEMAYRALKMCKVEKEIQLLDWKLDASMIF